MKDETIAIHGGFAGDDSGATAVPICQSVLKNHNFDPSPTLERVLELDDWARQEVKRWIQS